MPLIGDMGFMPVAPPQEVTARQLGVMTEANQTHQIPSEGYGNDWSAFGIIQ